MWKKNRTPGWFNKRFTPSGPKTYVHTLAHRCYTHSGQPLIRTRRDSVSCRMTGGGEGEEAAEVPYVRKSCSLHHKDHMLASESQRGGRARRGRTKRKDYRRTEGGRVCMWISVSFMCQHENAGINGLLCTLLRNTLLLRTWEHVRVHVVTHCCLCVLLGRLPLWAFAYQICMAEYESASL